MKLTITIIAAALTLSACAQSPDSIAPVYVSPVAYSGYSCAQLNAEAARINARLSTATGQQNQQSDNDAAMTAVALILFWPAAFWIGGNDQSGAIAQLRGDAEAVNAAAIARNC